MRIALIGDTFPPLRTSGAVQLRDLAREFGRQGHALTVMIPSADLVTPYSLEKSDGFEVLRLGSPRTKDVGYIRRTASEFLMPLAMKRNLDLGPHRNTRWDGVVWYSPSIFLAPLVNHLKQGGDCPSYLILRDIFPQWALDMGLLKRGPVYSIFEGIANRQYRAADIIGVQSPGNLAFFESAQGLHAELEVLHNWLGAPSSNRCRIRISETSLAGRKILVYAGNMGVAQGMDILVELVDRLRQREDIGFIFVGRGGDALRIRNEIESRKLGNTLFFDEIDPDEIPDLYAQCHVGLVALDHRHTSHNVPGKFISYLQAGLPVLATLNRGNDLATMIGRNRIGRVSAANDIDHLVSMTTEILAELQSDPELRSRCRTLFSSAFSATAAVSQICDALRRNRNR